MKNLELKKGSRSAALLSAALSWGTLLALSTSCSSSGYKNTYRDPEVSKTEVERPLVDEKYSLKKDREAMESLRSEIPEKKKNENDELSFILNLMADHQRNPESIRSQFDQALRKKRELFDKDIRREREDFTQKERKNREEFLAQMKEKRDQKFQQKLKPTERADFMKEQDGQRAEYFAAEKDRRNDFESDVRERRKNFEDYAREKQNWFNQELRSYRKSFEENKKSQQKEKISEMEELENELREARQKKGFFLQSGEGS